MAVASFVADKSAYARLHQPAVFERLAPFLESGLVATCSMIDLEILCSCRSPDEYDAVSPERAGLERLDIVQADWDQAVDVQTPAGQGLSLTFRTSRDRYGPHFNWRRSAVDAGWDV